jgi:hypothetical protein
LHPFEKEFFMLAPITHYLPITTIRRSRLLPVPGRVVARKGQKVNATDVIAEANLAPEHLLLDLARGLGLPPNKADASLQYRAGEEVQEGDVIAGPVGIARRVIRAPRSGRIVLAGSGQVLLEVESRHFELRAGLPGIVTELIPDRGVEIETTGALIQGVWGNGPIDIGLLGVVSANPQDELTAQQLDVSQRGLVIVGGYCGAGEALEYAADIPLRGLIIPSMDSTLVPQALKLRIPVVVLEGFGNIPMNNTAYKLLATNDRREVVVNAESRDRYANTRPEIVIPLPASSQLPLPNETDTFSLGQLVRITSAPYRGTIGTISALLPGRTTLKSGIRVVAAEVRLEGGEDTVLPLTNLEVLE